MYEREKIGSWRVICQACLEESAKRNHFAASDPGAFRDYDEEFRVASDLNPGSPCPSCHASRATRTTPGKRIVPAGANVVSPAFITTFDKDVPNIMSSAKARASQEMAHDEDLRAAFEAMQRDYAIKDVHLADITALSCTYGYRVGRFTKEIPFQDGTIFLKSDHCETLVFEFDEKRIPEANRERILHAISHALLQIAGYISGLDNEVYKEFIHAQSCSVMIFTTEAGGCELFVKEPAKLDRWLKRSRAVVHECKNQCSEGCPWCIHLRTWQCYRNNHDLDRVSLAQLWNRKVI